MPAHRSADVNIIGFLIVLLKVIPFVLMLH